MVDEILEFAFSHVDFVDIMPKTILSIVDNLICIRNPCCLATKNVCIVVPVVQVIFYIGFGNGAVGTWKRQVWQPFSGV